MGNLAFKIEEIKNNKGLKINIKPELSLFSDSLTQYSKLKDLTIDCVFSIGASSIMLEAEVEADIELTCSLCLKKFDKKIKETIEEFYDINNEEIDLKGILSETLSMMEPMRPVCSKDCHNDLIEKYSAKHAMQSQFSKLKDCKFK